MSFDGDDSIESLSDFDVDAACPTGAAEGYGSRSFPQEARFDEDRASSEAPQYPSPPAAPVGQALSTSKSLQNLIELSRSKGEGNHNEDEDNISVGSWESTSNPKHPNEVHMPLGNYTPEDLIKIEKGKAKTESDHKIFIEWFKDASTNRLLRNRDDWVVAVHETIVEQGGENFEQIIEGMIDTEFKDGDRKRKLLYVLRSTRWSHGKITYIELWWMLVLCCEGKIGRDQFDKMEYDTPKKDKEKKKDTNKSEAATKREYVKFTTALTTALDERVDKKLLGKNNNHEVTTKSNVIKYAQQVVANDNSLSDLTKRRLNCVLDKSMGRTYYEMFWMTIKSFEVMEGTRGPYKQKRKRAESEKG